MSIVKSTILKKIGLLLGRNFDDCEDFPQLSQQEIMTLRGNTGVLDEIYSEIRDSSPVAPTLKEVAPATALAKFRDVRPVSEDEVLSSLSLDQLISMGAREAQETRKAQRVVTTVNAPQPELHDSFVVDATNTDLRRLAVEIARRLRGTDKVIARTRVDVGEYVVVVNVEKLRLTGLKRADDTEFMNRYNVRSRALQQLVRTLLPKGPLGKEMLKKMKCYAGGEHPHKSELQRDSKEFPLITRANAAAKKHR